MKRFWFISTLSLRLVFDFRKPIEIMKISWVSTDHSHIINISQQILEICESRPKAIRVYNSNTDIKLKKLAIVRVENFIDNEKIQLFGKV